MSDKPRKPGPNFDAQSRFQDLFSNMPQGSALHEIVTDASGRAVDYRFLDINPAFERLTGLRREGVIGRLATEVLPGIEPYWIETYGRVALEGEPATFERYFPEPLNRWYQVYAYRPAPRQFAVIFLDVTERKKVEADLRQSQSLLKAVVESIPDAIYAKDDRGRLVLVNPAAIRSVGKPADKILGRDDREIYGDPAVAEAILENDRRVMATGQAESFEEKLQTPEGYRDYLDTKMPWRDDEGRTLGIIGLSRDITEIKKAEEDLRESEGRLAKAQEIAHLGSWELDLERNVLTWSDEVFRIFGLQPGEFGANYEAFLDAVHPEDRPAVEKEFSKSLQFKPGAEAEHSLEYRIVRRDTGETRVVNAKWRLPANSSGRAGRVVGLILDITELKKAEALRQALAEQEKARLGAAVEQASDSVVMVDLDGAIRYVNAAFESLNREPRDKVLGRSYFEFMASQSPATAAEMREAVGRGVPWHGPLQGSIPGRGLVELEVTISPAHDPAGKVIGGLITERDITRESALERQVRQAQKMEALGTLAGGITHDFNNILGAIIVSTELALLDLELSHPARKALPTVLQAANRGKELVKQIITFSRQREWERKPLEVAPIAKEAVKFLRSTLPKNITIRDAVSPASGAVLGDPSHVHQILVNLCQNGALAMEERGGDLEIRVEPIEADEPLVLRHPELRVGGYVRITVSDTGCGIPRENLERIFEPFFTTRGAGAGSGLGLAVVHGIVRSYGGTITVYSEVGRGSVFHVYLPRLEAAAEAAKTGETAQPVRGRERLLIVEDDAPQRTSMTRSLAKLGYSVTARASARAALTLFRRDPAAFDLVITDQIMPRMTGLDLTKALLKIRPDLPVILCTGFSEKVNGESLKQSGVREFIMKPFTLPEITRLIGQALRKGRSL